MRRTPGLFFHLKDFLQDAAQKPGGLDNDDLHGFLLSLSAHTAAPAADQQERHKEQEEPGGKDRGDQNPGTKRHGEYPQPATVLHISPLLVSWAVISIHSILEMVRLEPGTELWYTYPIMLLEVRDGISEKGQLRL